MTKILQIEWSEHFPPNLGYGVKTSSYDHVYSLNIPEQLNYFIEWKSWKEYDEYCISCGNEYIAAGVDLDDAKHLAQSHFETLIRSCLVETV